MYFLSLLSRACKLFFNRTSRIIIALSNQTIFFLSSNAGDPPKSLVIRLARLNYRVSAAGNSIIMLAVETIN